MLTSGLYVIMEHFPLKQKPVSSLRPQRIILFILGICVVLWATQQAPFGGWRYLCGFSMQEEYIGLFALVAISFIKYNNKPALVVRDIRQLPFASICMVITGIYMAEGIVQKNVIDILMNGIIEGKALYGYQTMALFGLLLSFLTELCSNTAITSLGLPLSNMMMKLSHIGILPCIFLITFSANSAFIYQPQHRLMHWFWGQKIIFTYTIFSGGWD